MESLETQWNYKYVQRIIDFPFRRVGLEELLTSTILPQTLFNKNTYSSSLMGWSA